MQSMKRYYQYLKQKVFRKSFSLAEKCRLQFGGAVLFSLILALLIPYFWMNKLTEKTALDSGRAISQVFYENHFEIGMSGSENRPHLSENAVLLTDPNHLVRLIRLSDNTEELPPALSDRQREELNHIRGKKTINDSAWAEQDVQG
ncbi:MAG: hypothetical protein ACYSTO_11670, partial [Planctomycetota bacterium]